MKELTEEQKQEYLKRMLEEVEREDTEWAHINADDILVEILHDIGGFNEILEAYDHVGKWYS